LEPQSRNLTFSAEVLFAMLKTNMSGTITAAPEPRLLPLANTTLHLWQQQHHFAEPARFSANFLNPRSSDNDPKRTPRRFPAGGFFCWRPQPGIVAA